MADTPTSGHIILDATGYRCPVPVLKVEAALRKMAAGERLLVRADDPVAVVDIPHFCRTAGHAVERAPDEGPACVFLVTHGEK
ncbi:MAG: sulfurtransferase TusA family protein [Pseudomonadota bacterium]